ncbi:MAG TPA: hypothetical protein VJW76_06115 [Verrucomicrobiae bacterium]|nr:hypothetical protein [Verrucomicrobiae bacterium]
MKRLPGSIGLLSLAISVRAHDSSVPHTHSYAGEHSDLFILSLATLAAGVAGVLLIRLSGRWRSKASAVAKRRR